MNPFYVRRRVQIDVMAGFAIVWEGLCELLNCVRACSSSVQDCVESPRLCDTLRAKFVCATCMA